MTQPKHVDRQTKRWNLSRKVLCEETGCAPQAHGCTLLYPVFQRPLPLGTVGAGKLQKAVAAAEGTMVVVAVAVVVVVVVAVVVVWL